jgi:hypothetical protein
MKKLRCVLRILLRHFHPRLCWHRFPFLYVEWNVADGDVGFCEIVCIALSHDLTLYLTQLLRQVKYISDRVSAGQTVALGVDSIGGTGGGICTRNPARNWLPKPARLLISPRPHSIRGPSLDVPRLHLGAVRWWPSNQHHLCLHADDRTLSLFSICVYMGELKSL